MITLVPIGGLCNRMRAIASGVFVSKALGIPLKVVWKKNNDCYADFSDLFCLPSSLSSAFLSSSFSLPLPYSLSLPLQEYFTVRPFTLSDFYLSYSRKSNLFIPGLLRRFIFDFQYVGKEERLDENLNIFKNSDIIEISEGKLKPAEIFIISGYSFAKHYPVVNLFKPLPELMDKISSITSEFGTNTVGVHIRRGDNQLAIAKNSVEDFFEKMDSLIAIDNSVKFYLATDSEEVRNSAISRFGNRLLHNNSLLSRKSVEGMKDAVVDLWSLAGCREILGSYNSSFSDMAASLKGCHPLRET